MTRRKSEPNDEGPPGPGAWVVSFNDCMTNMLCFFVLLVSFSSFDVEARGRIVGAFQSMSADSLFSRNTRAKDSAVSPADKIFDVTEQGSEKPTDSAPKPVDKPKRSPIPFSLDAHSDRVAVRIPSGQLFWAAGSGLTMRGRKTLEMLASFLKLVPRRVIIRQIVPAGYSESRPAESDLSRSWAIMSFLTNAKGLSPDRFAIAGARIAPKGSGAQELTMEIVLLKRSTYR